MNNDLCYQAINNKKIVLKSSGKQYRDFLSTNSLFEILENLINNSMFKNKFYIFNVGNGKPKSILSIAKIIQKRYKVSLYKLTTSKISSFIAEVSV